MLPRLHKRFVRKEPLAISVNLSVRQLQSDSIVDVRVALEESGLPPESLVLEITESVMMSDTDFAVRLSDLKALGVRLAMDDFGTGYSSLSYLSRFPVDILKMDRSFVAAGENVARSPRSSRSARASTSTSSPKASSSRNRTLMRPRLRDRPGFPLRARCQLGPHVPRGPARVVGPRRGDECSIVTRRSTDPAGSSGRGSSRRFATATSACCGWAWRSRSSAMESS
jgi:hypothetical protein